MAHLAGRGTFAPSVFLKHYGTGAGVGAGVGTTGFAAGLAVVVGTSVRMRSPSTVPGWQMRVATLYQEVLASSSLSFSFVRLFCSAVTSLSESW